MSLGELRFTVNRGKTQRCSKYPLGIPKKGPPRSQTRASLPTLCLRAGRVQTRRQKLVINQVTEQVSSSRGIQNLSVLMGYVRKTCPDDYEVTG